MIAGGERIGDRIGDRIGERIFRAGLRLRHAAFGPHGQPSDARELAILGDVAEWRAARRCAARLGLPVHPDPPKSWDTLLALSAVLRSAPRDGRILDAGGTLYSVLLPSLYLYGYRDLWAINPMFARERTRGPIRYVPGDATRTPWQSGSFHAIACLSVVEHGVDLDAFFAESARLLVPGGALAVSTDYWPAPVDTGGKVAYGVPIRIFDARDLAGWYERAARHGLVASAHVDPAQLQAVPPERAVEWRRFGLRYTFAFVVLRKQG